MKSETMFHRAAIRQSPVSHTAVYQAAFGGVAPTAALGLEPTRHPLWGRAQFFLERVFRVALRMTRHLTAGMTRHAPRRLLLCESLPLGERRFVAVVEFERARFLVGGTSASLVLLARLGEGCQENEAEERATTNAVPPRASPTPETSGGARP